MKGSTSRNRPPERLAGQNQRMQQIGETGQTSG